MKTSLLGLTMTFQDILWEFDIASNRSKSTPMRWLSSLRAAPQFWGFWGVIVRQYLPQLFALNFQRRLKQLWEGFEGSMKVKAFESWGSKRQFENRTMMLTNRMLAFAKEGFVNAGGRLNSFSFIIIFYILFKLSQSEMMHGNQRTLKQTATNARLGGSSASPRKITIYQAPMRPRNNVHTQQRNDENISQETPKPRKSVSSTCKIHQDNFESYLSSAIKEMTDKKQRLESCIKFFNLMQSQNAQLRCLAHSNVLTIYCQTERRVLCANCVYGSTRHRTHKLIPLKDAQDFIVEDNALLWKIVESDLKEMDHTIRNCQENTIIFQKQMKTHVKGIQEEYAVKVEQLKSIYSLRKKKVQKFFQDLINNSRDIEKEIEQFKFKVWETVSKLGIGKRSESNNSEIEVSRQVLCVNMSEITKLSFRKMTSRDIEKITSKISKI